MQGSAAFACIVCLQAMTWACGARTNTAGVPPQTAQAPTEPPPPVVITSEPPTPPAATSPVRPEVVVDECAVTAAQGEPIITVALTDGVDPANALHPSNESERLLFRQVYETLVRADCMGRVRPGLAASWRLEDDGRTWTVTLRENARFSDGTPVSAADVRASWIDASAGDELRPHIGRLVESVVPVGDRSLAIRLRTRRSDAPLALAHPDLAIGKPVAESRWPIGTRSARITVDGDAVSGIAAASVITVVRDNLPSRRFLVVSGDPRDALDRGVDLLLTRDPATLSYAAPLPHFQTVPLAWQRAHVLLTPGRSRTSPSLSDEARHVLAVDAVRGEARGAAGPFWWQMLPDCEVSSLPARDQSSPIPRIVYDESDRTARDLAERLVGLVRASSPSATVFLDALLPDRPRRTYQRATGLSGDALARARRNGSDAGYIVSIDSLPLDPCRDLRALMDGVRWLDPETIVPLVDTRLHAILRRGRSGAAAEWDGGLVLAEASGPR